MVLEHAYTIVTGMLAQLRALTEQAQHAEQSTARQLRDATRALDEMLAREQIAASQHLPQARGLAQQVQALRAECTRLEQQAQAARHAVKQLDQLVRQIEMSSTTLTDQPVTDGAAQVNDPWVMALRSQVILGREEERIRLAREVHDGPAQVLANALMLAEQSKHLLQQERTAQLPVLLERMCGSTRDGLHEVRQFIADLRPGVIAEQGLVAAIRDYVERYRNLHGTAVTMRLDDTLPRLPTETEIVLYRIVQEALQNAHKHARGAPVTVQLVARAGAIHLTVRDEGGGFDVKEVARRAGRESWGLTSMRERADMIGARLTVTSHRGRGTEVAVAVPMAVPARGSGAPAPTQ